MSIIDLKSLLPAPAEPTVEMEPKPKWTRQEAVNLCVLIESICVEYGCHVALTGGTLYKHGERKDCDVLFYRIRQIPEINIDGLFAALRDAGIDRVSGQGWCHKAIYQGKGIDMFFPEADDGEYGA